MAGFVTDAGAEVNGEWEAEAVCVEEGFKAVRVICFSCLAIFLLACIEKESSGEAFEVEEGTDAGVGIGEREGVTGAQRGETMPGEFHPPGRLDFVAVIIGFVGFMLVSTIERKGVMQGKAREVKTGFSPPGFAVINIFPRGMGISPV